MTDDTKATTPEETGKPDAPKRGCRRTIGCALQAFGLFFLVCVLAVAGTGAAFWHWANHDQRSPDAKKTLLCEIREGDSLRAIAKRLEEKDIASPWQCMVALTIAKRAERGLQIGYFQFAPGTPPLAVLQRLLEKAPPLNISVTFPEGWTLLQIAQRLEQKKVIKDKTLFLAACEDPELLHSLKIPLACAEGFLFPDTYFFTPDTDPSDIVRRLSKKFQEVAFSPKQLGLLPELNSPNAYPLDFAQSVILASIIEREARVAEEMPLIASVYHNRLRKKMPLQSCATVRYAMNNWTSRLTYDDLKYDSPYNTYLQRGLPPGPICNPGKEALEAAFRPEKSDFLYYVYKGNGRHAFSKTLADHQKATTQYRDAWTFPARN